MEIDEHTTEVARPVPSKSQVLCCVCGVLIDVNPSNMCAQCIQTHVDITEGLIRDYILVYCPECERYLQPPKYWSRADLESRELLTICLKKIRGLSKYHLVDASFIWTEPHSKRLKVKLALQKEVFTNTVIQQQVQVDYEVHWKQCEGCAKVATGQPQWDAVVQLRQKLDHKRTFLYLEQIILKHRMHEDTIRIEGHPNGLDFFFNHRSHAASFVEFINVHAPALRIDASQLVSHDSKCNTAVLHTTFSLEIAPICREDLICLPGRISASMGGFGPVVLVHKVFSSIVFVDPQTLRASEMEGTLYWKNPFGALANTRQLKVFLVIDIVPTGHTNGKFALAEATVCLEDHIGKGEEWTVKTHLGNVLQPGDLAKGYLLSSINHNNESIDKLKPEQIPDVVLVHKHFPSQVRRRGKRNWTVKTLPVVSDGALSSTGRKRGGGDDVDARGVSAAEFDGFLDDLERDAEYRQNVALYKKTEGISAPSKVRFSTNQPKPDTSQVPDMAATAAANSGETGDDEDECPQVQIEELLEELRVTEKRQRSSVEKQPGRETVSDDDDGEGFLPPEAKKKGAQ